MMIKRISIITNLSFMLVPIPRPGGILTMRNFGKGKESGDVDWTEYGWKTDTNWENQANWVPVGKVTEMKSLHHPEYEYFDLDSSVKGRYFIIKVTYSGTRDMVEFAEIDLQTVD